MKPARGLCTVVLVLLISGAGAARALGERQCLAVVGLAARGVEAIGMGRYVAEQVQGIACRKAWMR